MTTSVETEVRYPDGRVSLASPQEISASGYANGDLAPLPIERRTWSTYNYAALWVGMSHNIPTYLLASGLIAVGMNWVQALVTIALANLIVLLPHAGEQPRRNQVRHPVSRVRAGVVRSARG
jgi:nucleobase:cation symporter-1, NCS1 family